jgi:hypothetical protein
MFRASSCPSSGATTPAVAVEAATAGVVAPDDGHENDRNMLSSI